MIITVSGTPGTGKTTLAKKLALKLKYKYVDVKRLISLHKISEGFDRKRRCYVVDTKKLNKLLVSKIKENKNLIIDSHLSHYLDKKYVDLCLITKCDLKELEKRLKRRRYNKAKIRENLDSEIFNICEIEAREKGHKMLIIDTTNGIKIKEVLKKI